MADVLLMNFDGTMVALRPVTGAARAWIDEYVAHEPYMWLGESLCLEVRYAAPVVAGMELANLNVREVHA